MLFVDLITYAIAPMLPKGAPAAVQSLFTFDLKNVVII
jgi:hypothetical protein